jgi:hypothetical protein
MCGEKGDNIKICQAQSTRLSWQVIHKKLIAISRNGTYISYAVSNRALIKDALRLLGLEASELTNWA